MTPTPDAVEHDFVEDFFFEGGYPAGRRRHVAVARRPRVVALSPLHRTVPVDRQPRVVAVVLEV